MRSRRDRYQEALGLIDSAELAVRRAEAAVAAAVDPTERDVAETQLDEIFALQDEVAERVAPAVEARRRQVVQAGWEAIRSLKGEPGANWDAKHRRWHSTAVKAWLIRRCGGKVYLRAFPW